MLKFITRFYYVSELWTDFTHCFGVSIDDFEQVNVGYITWGFSTSFMSIFIQMFQKLILKKKKKLKNFDA